ncbi:MAG: glycerol-3-phosphate 1-O-acyltransferase PlsY [Lachnospiraceae bacterium]|nr:glycerol-3-phosphate 1-O-acyltransferase PlsY [Lachnospiraceae bacterium]
MNTILLRVFCVLGGYLLGCIQTSYIIGRMKGIDIREHGSGNAGTTNTLRVLGKKYGAIVFLVDLLKCVAASLIAYFVFRNSHPDMVYLFKLYAGFGCVLGHNFPFFLGFRGGKGIAATGGLIASFYWPFIPVAAVSFFLTFVLTNYVSLGSLIMCFNFFVQMVIFVLLHPLGFVQNSASAVQVEMIIIAFIITTLAFVRHRANIGRLVRHEERKTYLSKKNKAE